MQSVKPWVTVLLENYNTLIYNGQNDIILSAPNCENFLNQLEWTGASEWKSANRQVWKLDPKDATPAGYVKKGASLTYVVVRQAGHLIPQDQPERALDLITRFIENQPWA
jgi:vitellogenic carboxypeptidase-like protein